ncbi:MAG TPA: TetR/AcrR family transcriptional regulator, partial [Gemmatimonadales bacterium]|nr:TetR/AcrR family transcriptional regulator [Gemmatimonadales bacterium]
IALEKGLARTSLRDISHDLNMSMGSIANYFPKRQGIITFAAEQARHSRKSDIDRMMQAPDPKKALMGWMIDLVESDAFAKSALLELELITEAYRSEEVKEILSDNAQFILDMATQILRDRDHDQQLARQRAWQLLIFYFGLAVFALLDMKPAGEDTTNALAPIFQVGDKS